MIVESTKPVNLRDNDYKGMWFHGDIIIPFLGEEMWIPVSQKNETEIPTNIMVCVRDRHLFFNVENTND
jgi:hypothetical protein